LEIRYRFREMKKGNEAVSKPEGDGDPERGRPKYLGGGRNE
jgi:hypothetical protein